MTLRLRKPQLKTICLEEIVCEESVKSTKFGQLISSENGLWCIMVIKTSGNEQEEAV